MLGIRESIVIPKDQSFRVLRWTRDFKEMESLLPSGATAPLSGEGAHWHFHPEMELTFVLSGSGTRFVGDHIGPFDSGDLVLLGSDLPHYWLSRGASSGISIQWRFPADHPFWMLPENRGLAPLFERASKGLRFSATGAAEVRRLLHEMPAARNAGRLGLLIRILSGLDAIPRKEIETLSSRSFAILNDPEDQKAITMAVRHLIAHFREQIRMEDLLAITRMSRTTFTRQFKRHSGHTFSDFLTKLRLQAACRALRESNLPILGISLDCGFTQISFFNRVFKRAMGRTPREYRKAEGQA